MSTKGESELWTEGESEPWCDISIIITIDYITLALAIFLMTITVILIPCHHRLRKQHYIFPYNLVLSDLTSAILVVILIAVELPRQPFLLVRIMLFATYFQSILSIVLITGYQFITIRLDPFGALNIITTPRLIATCVLTWMISIAISAAVYATNTKASLLVFLSISWTSNIITGLCYILIYRSIAKVPYDGRITLERKQQNQRVLRTFGLVFGTTVLCWIFAWVGSTLSLTGFDDMCLSQLGFVMIGVNWIANSIIYWWRLKEFRSMFTFCKRRQEIGVIEI